jgi:phage gp36-like protein
MSYASLQTLIDQYGEAEVVRSADRDQDGVADADVVERALTGADGIIDSYVGVKYELPINPVPDVLVEYAGDIALYRMSAEVGTYTEEKRQRYDDAIKWLMAVAAGKAVLGGQPEPPPKGGEGNIRLVAQPREFTRSYTGGIL